MENFPLEFTDIFCAEIFQNFDGRRSQIKWMKSKYEVRKVKKERSSSRRDSVVMLYIVVKRMDSRERLIRVQILVVSLTSCVTLVSLLN